MAVADLDDNGYPDVATTHGTDNGEVWVLMNPALHAR
jgi:hypothetical protein